jgi:hypothetical protein
MTEERKQEMSTTTHAPKRIDPAASLHAEALGQAKSYGRLAGRRIIVKPGTRIFRSTCAATCCSPKRRWK